jgi:hypothetical protein
VTTDSSLDWMISVDDHVIEPPGAWQDRVPARYKDVAPRMVEGPDCIGLMRRQLAHLSVEDQVKILRGNAERLFEFTPAPVPSADV